MALASFAGRTERQSGTPRCGAGNEFEGTAMVKLRGEITGK